MTEKKLTENINFVKKNKDSLLKEHHNKYLLIYKEELVESFDNYENAAQEGVRRFGIEANFLIYHLLDKEPLNFVFNASL